MKRDSIVRDIHSHIVCGHGPGRSLALHESGGQKACRHNGARHGVPKPAGQVFACIQKIRTRNKDTATCLKGAIHVQELGLRQVTVVNSRT